MYRSENSSINRFASLTSNHENHKKHVLNEINCSLITHARILYTRLCECFVLTLLALSNLFGNGNGSMFVTFCFIVRWYVCDSSIMHLFATIVYCYMYRNRCFFATRNRYFFSWHFLTLERPNTEITTKLIFLPFLSFSLCIFFSFCTCTRTVRTQIH